MAIFSVIDTTDGGDSGYEGFVKDAANWSALESALSAATTKILVGGGVGSAPVFTTATGSGSPVRATSPTITTPTISGHAVIEGVTPTGATGTGNMVFSNSPTFVTPALGTPASGVLSNCTAGNESAKGVLELATTAEAVTGTDTERAVTAAGITAHLAAPKPIGETTPNTIRGTNVEIYKTASADSPLTAAQCSGTIVSNYGMTDADCAITLPAAAAGLSFVCVLPAVRARYFRLTADGSDVIYLSGVAGSGGGYVGVASGYLTGSACSMFTFKASDGGFDWYCLPIYGAWVAG